MRPSGGRSRAVPAVIVLAVAGLAVQLTGTARWGIGVSSDSVAYADVASNLLGGRGMTSVFIGDGQPTAMTHWTPMFPALLSLLGLFGLDPLNAARWLNAFLFAANIAVVGLITGRCTRSTWAAVLGSVLMLGAFCMLLVHFMAWTEPLFIFLGFSGLALLAAHLERPRTGLLIGSSVFLSLAFLTRYQGAALVATGLVAVALAGRKTRRGRALDAFILAAVSMLPMATWMARSILVPGTPSVRTVAFHPITPDDVASGLSTISRWFVPARLLPGSAAHVLVGAAVLSTVAILLLVRIRLLRQAAGHGHSSPLLRERGATPCLLAGFVVATGVLIVVSRSFLDPLVRPDDRLLSSVYAACVVLILWLGWPATRSPGRPPAVRIGAVILCAVIAGATVVRGARWVAAFHVEGKGYSGRTWTQSETLRQISDLPPRFSVYTNAPAAVFLLTDRAVRTLPARLRPGTGADDPDYGSRLAYMEKQIAGDQAVLVYFRTESRNWDPSEEELRERLPLRPIATAADGVIYAGQE